MDEWINTPLKKLNPEEVLSDFTQMFQRAGVLVGQFGNLTNVSRPKAQATLL